MYSNIVHLRRTITTRRSSVARGGHIMTSSEVCPFHRHLATAAACKAAVTTIYTDHHLEFVIVTIISNSQIQRYKYFSHDGDDSRHRKYTAHQCSWTPNKHGRVGSTQDFRRHQHGLPGSVSASYKAQRPAKPSLRRCIIQYQSVESQYSTDRESAGIRWQAFVSEYVQQRYCDCIVRC